MRRLRWPTKNGLLHAHRPTQARFERIGEVVGVLRDDGVALLEPQHALGLDTEGAHAAAPSSTRPIPARALRYGTWISNPSDETKPARSTRASTPATRAFAHAQERERRLGQVDVGERLQQLAAARTREIERGAMTGGVDECAVHAPARVPQQQLAIHAGRATGGGRDVVALRPPSRAITPSSRTMPPSSSSNP